MFSDIITRIKLLFLRDKGLYYNIKSITGFFPHNIEVYKQAFLHKSLKIRNENGKLVNNERLEFLGDAILGAVAGHIVFRRFPGKKEGFLTTTRSKLVQRETLGKLAKEMGITKLIHSTNNNYTHNSYIGGNALEALVGAIYLDKGYNTCMKFVEKKVFSRLASIEKLAYREVNFKSKLLEWAQKNRVSIKFELTAQEQDNNGNPLFENMVILENINGCKAKGYSKKESQQKAARLTYDKIRKDSLFLDAVFAAKEERLKEEESGEKYENDTDQNG